MRVQRLVVSLAASTAAAALAACDHASDPSSPGETVAVAPAVVLATAGTDNVLRAQVLYRASGADSARAELVAPDGSLVPAPYRHPGATDTATVVGLRPATTYTVQIAAVAGGRTTRAPGGTVTTGALPAPLATVALSNVRGKTTVPFAVTGVTVGSNYYAVAFDSTGAIVWYRDFTDRGLPVSGVQRQANGDFTAYLGSTAGSQDLPGYYVEFTAAGDLVRTWQAPTGYFTDNHELLLTGTGASLRAHFFSYDMRTTDLSAYGGPTNATVVGHEVRRLDAAGNVEFTFSGWDNFTFADRIGETPIGQLSGSDFDHPNALSLDNAGNYLVSWRDLNTVTDINPTTGAVLWTLGGRRGQFTFVNDPRNGFSKQHYVRMLPNGHILMFDNGVDASPQESRAVEYALDPTAKTATMVWEYRHSPALFSYYIGNVNRFANGDTWVNFGDLGHVVEVAADGTVVWEADLTVGGTVRGAYRIIPLTSLDR